MVTAAGGKGAAGKKLKSVAGWYGKYGKGGNGTDALGFSAMPGSFRFPDPDGGFEPFLGQDGIWWSATEGNAGNPYYLSMSSVSDSVSEHNSTSKHGLGSNYFKGFGFSVRCVQNQ